MQRNETVISEDGGGRKNTENNILLLNENKSEKYDSKNNSKKSSPRSDEGLKKNEEIAKVLSKFAANSKNNIFSSSNNKSYVNTENFNQNFTGNMGSQIDVQNILIENLRNGENVYYCLNMICSISDSVLNLKLAE